MSDDEDDSGLKGDGKILVFGRIRPPTKRNYVNPDMYEVDRNKLVLGRAGRYEDEHGPDNSIPSYKFKFNHLFDQSTTQEQIFTRLAYPILKSFLGGFNATIFAYGQTGSGKTYTITGGPERYEDRGLIPRTLSSLFSEMQSASEFNYTVRISYLEIYQGVGYDLLDPNHETKNLQDLPRVSMTTDGDGNVVLKNIGELPVASVEVRGTCVCVCVCVRVCMYMCVHVCVSIRTQDALNLLFVGDTNRIICTTPSNDSSTRSHCIFTINLEARQVLMCM
jgi:kinesin family protein 6/9